ncbi:hypothetical protein FRC97_22555 [Paracidovorax citrulli]|uniref:Uncharacterized protein n=2 Tax=Paracidovorax citrulli TaxID=80869 RepID=A1TMT4_PARC0|nr:hypothetical protein Aave_1685 [Paracidovorax citrulli AAC00-1]ATG94712.1 hypothetical protein CQB05_12310 [Paracidovorax citrulli]UMT84062.1 hypothetical protein FRC75_12180 [Paracidovorax citrulli]UMT97529.1 hypothetical protein FRC97_22555 [Paracidovorax citrulli]
MGRIHAAFSSPPSPAGSRHSIIMSPKEIQVGKTYVNRGQGRTRRTVIAIGPKHVPRCWHGWTKPPAGTPGVLFEQNGRRENLYLSSFATWAGEEAPNEG